MMRLTRRRLAPDQETLSGPAQRELAEQTRAELADAGLDPDATGWPPGPGHPPRRSYLALKKSRVR